MDPIIVPYSDLKKASKKSGVDIIYQSREAGGYLLICPLGSLGVVLQSVIVPGQHDADITDFDSSHKSKANNWRKSFSQSGKLVVELEEVENGDKYYRQVSFPDISLGTGDTDGYSDLVLPFDFWFLSIEFYAGPGSNAVLGDTISAKISPVLPVDPVLQSLGLPASTGVTKSALAINDTTVSLDPLLMGDEDLIESFLRIGTILQFEDPANPGFPHASEYVVSSLDRVNSTVTLSRFDTASRLFVTSNVLLEAYATGAQIWRTLVAGERISVLPTYDGNQYGQTKIGSSKLPAGTPFRIHYFKKTGDTATRSISVNVEGLVGDRDN